MRRSLVAVLALTILAACSNDDKPRRPSPLVAVAKRCASKANGAELTCGRPIVRVASLRASQAYYRDALGFHVDWDHGDPPNFGSVSRGDFVLFMCEGCQSAAGAWSMTFVADIDKLHTELAHRNAIIKMPPTDMPWGLREMHVADPDGNVIRFGSHGEHDASR